MFLAPFADCLSTVTDQTIAQRMEHTLAILYRQSSRIKNIFVLRCDWLSDY